MEIPDKTAGPYAIMVMTDDGIHQPVHTRSDWASAVDIGTALLMEGIVGYGEKYEVPYETVVSCLDEFGEYEHSDLALQVMIVQLIPLRC